MNKIDGNKMIDIMDINKEDKAKKLLDDIMKNLKDFIASSGSMHDLKSKVDMLKQLDPIAGAKAEDLLENMEKNLEGAMAMTEQEKIDKLGEMVAGVMSGSLDVSSINNDNLAYMQDDQFNPHKIEGASNISNFA